MRTRTMNRFVAADVSRRSLLPLTEQPPNLTVYETLTADRIISQAGVMSVEPRGDMELQIDRATHNGVASK
ncbi:MAG TPA: hypothetical protein PLY00_05650 [Verrucomicrobiota bacterium]|nr:hypothetical protein [Verrucomicrobiota bacterium]OQC67751.1 MAG: hypothetical protein BWX48_00501 [Verrucomicrobia bacterium ADurb.Bin006]HOR70761.1 hypothetical protein [Verrucomicrobiota bacterium]HOU87371.1 hypothetical protein [Verrucomicrobiota bacterium]